jgi:cell division protein FtsL
MTSLAYKLLPQQEEQTTKQPLVRPRRVPQLHTGPRAHISVAPSAIVGFALVCVMIFAVLFARIQLDQVNEEQAALSTQLSALQKDYEDLSSQYEQLFDMEGIKSTLMENGTMQQVTVQQQTYMDLSQPDSTVVYEDDESKGLFPLSTMFADIVEYFR